MATRTQDPTIELPDVPAPEPPGRGAKSMTIGAVCKALKQEFPDISISKIRYLEYQKLLAPRRTPGGYRLYSPGDVARLRTILRLQRDEFLPLRVIRQELAAGRAAAPAAARKEGRPMRPASMTVGERGTVYTLEDVLEDFAASRLLFHTTEPDGVVLARAPEQVTVVDVLSAIREPPVSHDIDPAVVSSPVAEALRCRDEAVRRALGTVSLRSLATASDAGWTEPGTPGQPREIPPRRNVA